MKHTHGDAKKFRAGFLVKTGEGRAIGLADARQQRCKIRFRDHSSR
jgi:hypothetical protein